jgi:eukaryotic-like serine/threonine-protein kinase
MKDYELIERLHRGHAYDVFDAWSHERGCRVVVRTLRPDRRDPRPLLRGCRLLRRLAHPHLVRAYETSLRPPMVVLETLGGATLAALLEDGPLDEDDALQLGLQLSSAVRYLHRRGWLHLDLKPSNLIADGGRLKVIDLSIAQRPGRIRAGTGTERYMAPEQEGGGRVGPAADVWGIGAVLRAAGGPEEIVAACLRADAHERPTVDNVIGWLNRCGVTSASPPHPQPAA